jgi:hypothetical protein
LIWDCSLVQGLQRNDAPMHSILVGTFRDKRKLAIYLADARE